MTTVRIRFLGCGDAFGSGGRLQTYEKRVPFHLDYSTLMEHRSKLDCKRIVLTHLSSDMLSRSSELKLQAAHDGLEIVL